MLSQMVCLLTLVPCLWLPLPAQAVAPSPGLRQSQVLARVIAQERLLMRTLTRFQPRVETYIQSLRPDPDRGTAPAGDAYFLGTLDLNHGFREPLLVEAARGKLMHEFFPSGFLAMVTPDRTRFDLRHYMFSYQGEQFLGAVRCLMFDVRPRPGTAKGSFIGRIWVEDRRDAIVRFDGTYVPNPKHKYVHFDSWRMNLRPGLWLPVAIYSQEADQRTGWFSHIDFKAQVRFWGYQASQSHASSSHTGLQIETAAGAAVAGQGATAHERTPLRQEKLWALQAENNVLRRMQRAGLLAPPGPVDRVLETVVNNILVTNDLELHPPVRCRVLLTAPLESFTVGHTIVLSQGLINVLPDEASLAMMLAHELGHIVLDHAVNTDYAFDDRMMFPDTQLFARLRMARSPREEAGADAKGLQLLRHSPYAGNLASAGLFLEALQHAAHGLQNLITPELGNPLVIRGRLERMQALLRTAPQLQIRNVHQVAALPLGARLHLDPWSDRLSLLQAPVEPMLTPRDKLSFEITPFMPYLTWNTEPASSAKAGSVLSSASVTSSAH